MESTRLPTLAIAWELRAVMATATLLLVVSCGRNQVQPRQQNQGLTSWIVRLNESRPVILNGSWDQAESSWARLRKEAYSNEELDYWLKLQMEILEQTTNDKLKSGLRKNAIQQMYWFPDGSRKYLAWLKQGLATNLFEGGEVATKASELVSRLERGSEKSPPKRRPCLLCSVRSLRLIQFHFP
jgi:hypothetical protein